MALFSSVRNMVNNTSSYVPKMYNKGLNCILQKTSEMSHFYSQSPRDFLDMYLLSSKELMKNIAEDFEECREKKVIHKLRWEMHLK